MKIVLFRKKLVLGIIIFFIGSSIIPSISGTIKDENDQTIRNDVSTLSTLIEHEINIRNLQ